MLVYAHLLGRCKARLPAWKEEGFPLTRKKGLGLSIGTSWFDRTWGTRATLNDIEFPLTEMLLRGAVCNVCNPRAEGVAWQCLLGPHDFGQDSETGTRLVPIHQC